MRIEQVRALEILDSRGTPTIQAEVRLADGTSASAHAPSGASTGRHEAVELRDNHPARHAGRGVLLAVSNVNKILGPAILGLSADDQAAVDTRLIETDGSPNKARLGANAILAISCAVARAAAKKRQVPLWKHLAGHRKATLPIPMVNIISGGLHAGRNLEFQDFLVRPRGYRNLAAALEAVTQVHRTTGRLLAHHGCVLTGVADEGGWGPRLPNNETAVAILRQAITETGTNMDIVLDVAATHFYKDGHYQLEGRELTAANMADYLAPWLEKYGVRSIEDPLAEDDWDGWQLLTARLGNQVRLVGDDLFVTNKARLERGIAQHAANAVLVKMNQIGTLTETFGVIDQARLAGFGAVISARSGETEDGFLADLAVASGAGEIKIGSTTRSERLAKYNRLLEIEAWEFISAG